MKRLSMVYAVLLVILFWVIGTHIAFGLEQIDITGQDITAIMQKLQELNLSSQEQESISGWLSTHELERYTTLQISDNEEGGLWAVLSGPRSRAVTIIKKPQTPSVPDKPGAEIKPKPPEQSYKYYLNIAGQDISSIEQKLQDFKLSKREQEIIMTWLNHSKLDRYTIFAIGYDEEEALVVSMSGPETQSSAKFEKRVIQNIPVQVWKPEQLSPDSIKLDVTYDPELFLPKFNIPETTPIGGLKKLLPEIKPIEYTSKTTEPPKFEIPETTPIGGGMEIQIPDDITIRGATEPLDYRITSTDEIKLPETEYVLNP